MQNIDLNLPHRQLMDMLRKQLNEILSKDPFLHELNANMTAEEVKSLCDLANGQSMKIIVCKADHKQIEVIVPQNGTVKDLRQAIRRHVLLEHAREGESTRVSWKYVWQRYGLAFDGEKLLDDSKRLKDYGLTNNAKVKFVKRLRMKN